LGFRIITWFKLIPVYKTRLQREKVKKVKIKRRTPEATEALKDCLESTDWAALTDSTHDLEEAADTVSEYIRLCEDLVIPKKKLHIFPNNKPWVTWELKELLNQKKRVFKSSGSKGKI
jgi:hypothetical protein